MGFAHTRFFPAFVRAENHVHFTIGGREKSNGKKSAISPLTAGYKALSWPYSAVRVLIPASFVLKSAGGAPILRKGRRDIAIRTALICFTPSYRFTGQPGFSPRQLSCRLRAFLAALPY